MPFRQTVLPQFRDADPDGLVGLRGCMRNFQDIHTWFLHSLGKGNDVLPEKYGAAWVYTRYHVAIDGKLDYEDSVRLTAWVEPDRWPIFVTYNMLLEQHGRIVSRGKAETCVVSLAKRRPVLLSAVEWPEGLAEEIPSDIPPFIGLEKTAEGMEERYRREVRFADLDKSSHMTNLRYIEMFQDAYGSAFWDRLNPRQMEISFLSQCTEGETLSVYSREETDAVRLAALHADGSVAAVALFGR